MKFQYYLFGLTIGSDVELPELMPAVHAGAMDVRIELGHVPDSIENPSHFTSEDQYGHGVYQFWIEDVARYRVSNGIEIRIDPAPQAEPCDVRLYALGHAMGAVLHQRGVLPLHVCAVAVDSGAHAFCGVSGAGKSTLAAAFHHRGLPLLSDDLGVVAPDHRGNILFYPGFPRIKLWQDSLSHFGFNGHPMTRDFSGENKFQLQLHNSFKLDPLPIRRLYSLARGVVDSEPIIQAQTHHQSIGLLLQHTYRPELGRLVGNRSDHLRQCGLVARQITSFRFQRPWDLERIDTSLDFLLAHMRAQH